jgi:hypothetical protein
MKYITAIFACFVIVSATAQASFRQYTSEDGEKTAFARGVEIDKGYGSTYEFYPYYQASKYFMIIDEFVTSYGQNEFYFYFILDDGQKVYERRFAGYPFKQTEGGSYIQIEIEVDADFFKSLADAEKLDFIMTDHKLR